MKNKITITVPSIFYLLEMAESIKQQYLIRKHFCITFLSEKGIKYLELPYGVAVDCGDLSPEQLDDIKSMNSLAPKIDLSDFEGNMIK